MANIELNKTNLKTNLKRKENFDKLVQHHSAGKFKPKSIYRVIKLWSGFLS